MGFTRFWKQPYGIGSIAWRSIAEDTRQLLASVDVPLVGRAGGPIADDAIALNGLEPASGEWFALRTGSSDFECVKTYARPYDVVVAAVLIIAKHHAPSEILDVTSDVEAGGFWDAWTPAVAMRATAGVTISAQSLERLRADVSHESDPYEPAKLPEEVELDNEWQRICDGSLLKTFCERFFPPTYLRYQTSVRETPRGVKLQLRRSIDARSLPEKSPILRQKANELQTAWNESHGIQILTIQIR
jgi:hypothetical protein